MPDVLRVCPSMYSTGLLHLIDSPIQNTPSMTVKRDN